MTSLNAQDSGVQVLRRRILVVDDDVDSAELLEHFLGSQGHEVRIAHDAEGAVDLAGSFEPQIAVLDLTLPGVSGYDLLTTLSAISTLNSCKFIALTGHAGEAARRQALEAGFHVHLTKPVDFTVLLRALADDSVSSV